MYSPLSNLHFRLMAWRLRGRERPEFTSPVLAEAGVHPEMTVLDFGCGPGAFTLAAARLVGPEGRVYALDKHPLAVRMVREKAAALRLENVTTILSDRHTGLPDESADFILFYDILHLLQDQRSVLDELHRVLAPEGYLSVSDHHMEQDRIIVEIESGRRFRLSRKEAHTVLFVKIPAHELMFLISRPLQKSNVMDEVPFLSFGHPSPGGGRNQLGRNDFPCPPRGKGTEG